MGLSSSQARLLHLTSRMHQLEHKAAKIQADKLRLANDSDRAYADYLNTLEASKLQYKSIASDGSFEYRDLTPNILQNGVISDYTGEVMPNSLFLQRQDGRVMVTRAVADAFNLLGADTSCTLDEFVHNTTGEEKIPVPIMATRWVPDYNTIVGFTHANNISTGTYVPPSYTYPGIVANTTSSVTNTVTTSNVASYTPAANSGYSAYLPPSLDYSNFACNYDAGINYVMIDKIESGNTYVICDPHQLLDIADMILNDSASAAAQNVTFVLDTDIDLSGLDFKFDLLNNNTFDGNGHTIFGLTNRPLFNTLDNGNVQNLIIEDAHITKETTELGILAAHSSGNTTISNIVVHHASCESYKDAQSNIGGLIGSYEGNLEINNVYVMADVMGTGNIGGFVGASSDPSSTLIVNNSIFEGGLKDNGHYTSAEGGIIGETYDTSVQITNCQTQLFAHDSHADAYIGHAHTNYVITPGTPAGPSIVTNDPWKDPFALKPNFGGSYYANAICIPSIDVTGGTYQGLFYSNIYAAMVRAGEDPATINSANISNYIQNLLAQPHGENYIAGLNGRLEKYFGGDPNDTENLEFMHALINDVNNTTINVTDIPYYLKFYSLDYVAQFKDINDSWTPFVPETIGALTIPHTDNIKEEIVAAFNKEGFATTESQISNYIDNNYNTSNNEDLAYLANINNILTYGNSADIAVLNSNIVSNTKMTTLPTGSTNIDDASHYAITMSAYDSNYFTNNVVYEQVDVTTVTAHIPNINADGTGGLYSNVLAALNKAGYYDDHSNNPSTLPAKVATFINSFNDTDEDNIKLYFLNQNIVNYLNTSSNTAFINALYNDINNSTVNETIPYQTGSEVIDLGVRSTDDTSWAPVYDPGSKIQITVPTINTISNQLKYALATKGYSVTDAQLQDFFNLYNTSDVNDKIYLANLNRLIQSVSSMSTIYNKITAVPPQKLTNTASYNNPDKWEISFAANDVEIEPQYLMVEEEYDTGEVMYVWDTSNPEVAHAIALYSFARKGISIIEEPYASSYEYLQNIIESGEAVLTTFDPTQAAVVASLSTAEINALTGEKYDEFMGIKHTSVPTETSLQEVQDETNLKKAEAAYEAAMLQIDRKDRKYDADMANIENERNAVKQEMDTLKAVAKDNVERTFKLFS